MSRTAPRGEAGESLLELLIAVAIMGIAVVAVLGLISTSILMSDIHRKQATAGAYVRNYAESVERFVAGGNFDSSGTNYSAATVGFVAPFGFGSTVTTQCLSAAAAPAACASGTTVQRLTLTVASSDARVSEKLTVIVRKP